MSNAMDPVEPQSPAALKSLALTNASLSDTNARRPSDCQSHGRITPFEHTIPSILEYSPHSSSPESIRRTCWDWPSFPMGKLCVALSHATSASHSHVVLLALTMAPDSMTGDSPFILKSGKLKSGIYKMQDLYTGPIWLSMTS